MAHRRQTLSASEMRTKDALREVRIRSHVVKEFLGRPPGNGPDPEPHKRFFYFAKLLQNKYRESAEKDDDLLYEIFTNLVFSLQFYPPSDAGYDDVLYNLAVTNYTFYTSSSKGCCNDLDICIAHLQTCLELRMPGHPLREATLKELANVTCIRYERNGDEKDLGKLIELFGQVLELHPPGHPRHLVSLSNVAFAFGFRYDHCRNEKDLEKQIDYITQALDLCEPDNSDRFFLLFHLAASLGRRWDRYGDEEDLEEQIQSLTESLQSRIPDVPLRLKILEILHIALASRYILHHDEEDLKKQIVLSTQALEICTPGHPQRITFIHHLVSARVGCGVRDYNKTAVDQAFTLFERETDSSILTEAEGCRGALFWVFLADSFKHDSLGKAFINAIGRFRRYLSSDPTARLQYDKSCHATLKITRLDSLATDAAAYFIGEQDIEQAIELLDEGRSVIWSEMRRFREGLSSSYEERMGEDLSTRYRTVCRQICDLLNTEVKYRGCTECGCDTNSFSFEHTSQFNRDSFRIAMNEFVKTKKEKVKEFDSLVEEIRTIPGCEEFQSKRRFSELQMAAKEGPVIIVNCSERRSDAIIVFANRSPILIPLEAEFWAIMRAAHGSHRKSFSKSTDNHVSSDDPTSVLASTLQGLAALMWDHFVHRIVEELEKAGIEKGSRIWWCPTSFLTSLPLHAAGKGGDFLIDHFVSSFTPTLGTLIDAQRAMTTSSSPPRMLVVSQTETSGLDFAEEEADILSELGSFVDCIDEEEATPTSVVESLASYNWAHFICHCRVSDNPFDSSLILFNNSHLSLNEIIKKHLPNAQFAFLAACRTAKLITEKGLQDEVMHLAAAMQFCGFRSVVGSIWSMEDHDGPLIAEIFYKEMLAGDEEDGKRHTRAARALWRAVQVMRASNLPMERWANFVHIGA